MHARSPWLPGACAVAAALVTLACTSSSASLTAPTSSKCAIAVSGSPASFGANGGTGTLTISTTRECAWSAAAEAPWIALKAGTSGQGDASLPYSVANNPATAPRSAAIVVGSERVQLSQAAAACRYQLSRAADTVGAGGGSVSVDIETLSGCQWSAATDVGWLAIASGTSGSSSATIVLSVGENAGPARTGHLTAGGQTFSVAQERKSSPGPSPAPAPGPAPAPPPPPSAGQEVNLEGIVIGVAGKCPNISFTIGGRLVEASRDTEYKRGKCQDVSSGDSAKVTGIQDANGVVGATRIELSKQ
jgi:hypothetical protein